MAIFSFNISKELNNQFTVEQDGGTLILGNAEANRVMIKVTQDGEHVALEGSIVAQMLRADGQTLTWDGAIISGTAVVVLPASAYSVQGPAKLNIDLLSNDQRMTLAVLRLMVDSTTSNASVAPVDTVPDLESLLAKIQAMETATAAAVSASTFYPMVYTGQAVFPARKKEYYAIGNWVAGEVIPDKVSGQNYHYVLEIGSLIEGETFTIKAHNGMTARPWGIIDKDRVAMIWSEDDDAANDLVTVPEGGTGGTLIVQVGNSSISNAKVTRHLNLMSFEGRIEHFDDSLDQIAVQFDSGTAYVAGQMVYYNDMLYRFTANHPAGAWTGADASRVILSDEVGGIKSEVTDVKTALTNTQNLEDNIVFSGTYSGTGFVQVSRYISAGTYVIDVDSITSTDTDASTCLISFVYGNSYAGQFQIARGSNVRQEIVLDHYAENMYLYSSDTWPHSSVDSCTYSGFKLLQSYPLKDAIENAVEDFTAGLDEVNADLDETNENLSNVAENVNAIVKQLSTYETGERTYSAGVLTYVDNGVVTTTSYSTYATYVYSIDRPTAFKVTGYTRGASNYLAIGADSDGKAVQLVEQGKPSQSTTYTDYEFIIDAPDVVTVHICLYATPADVKIGVISQKPLNKLEPADVFDRKAWYNANNEITTIGSSFVLKKYVIDEENDYYLSTSFYGSDAGFSLITYFNSQNAPIGNECPNVSGGVVDAVERLKLTIPQGTAWAYVNSREYDAKLETDAEIVDQNAGELSILFVGNSLTQDGIAYLPYMLRTYFPEVKFRFYMWYNGGYDLSEQYTKFTADTACEIFSVAENSTSWTSTTAKMSAILSTYKFDIVCMQEYFNRKESYTTTDLTDWNNCRDYIVSHYTGGNGLKFVSLFHSPWMTNEQTVYDLTLSGNALILQKTVSDDMISTGIALHMARSTALDSLGDDGHLTPDNVHAQEGLPCLLETYTALLWVLDKLGINKSIYGLPFKMTAAIYSTINVPGPNIGTGVIEGTDAQNLLAQEVAVAAYKVGKKFVADNLA